MANTFNLPDVGEGLTEAEIIAWRVAVGDTVEVNDVVVDIETAKSAVELPIPYTGTVTELLAAEGETIEVGSPLIRIAGEEEDLAEDGPGQGQAGQARGGQEQETAGEAQAEPERAGGKSSKSSRGGRSKKAEREAKADKAAAEAGSGAGSAGATNGALVGSGPKADTAAPRERTRHTDLDLIDLSGLGIPDPEASPTAGSGGRDIADIVAKASPPVRALAKRLGVAVWDLVGSGRNGQITRDDVERQARAEVPSAAVQNTRSERVPATPAERGLLYDGPREEQVQVRSVRKATAENVTSSAFSAPHVSVFKEVDVTRTMELRRTLKQDPRYDGLSVSPMLFAAKALMRAVERTPQVNAVWEGHYYTLKNYVNLGIAAATPRGLVVPVVHDAHTMSLRELAAALTELAREAKEGRTTPAQMQGGTISITNIGSLGLDGGTPILPVGQVAILSLGRVMKKPWVVDGQVVPRDIMTIGGSFDHRLVDGDHAGKFTSDIAAVLEEPGLLLD